MSSLADDVAVEHKQLSTNSNDEEEIVNSNDLEETTLQEKPKCEVCKLNTARYKCPRCSIRTCSVICVKTHKAEKECDGVREAAEFVSVKQFDNLRLLSDYRFLENADRILYTAHSQADRLRIDDRKRLTRQQSLLQRECKLRCTNIYFAPVGLTKRRVNSSYCNRRMKLIYWRLRFECVGVENRLAFELPRVDESEPVSSILNAFISGKRLHTMDEEEACKPADDSLKLKFKGKQRAADWTDDDDEKHEAMRRRFVAFLGGTSVCELSAALKIETFPFSRRSRRQDEVQIESTSRSELVKVGKDDVQMKVFIPKAEKKTNNSERIDLGKPLKELLRGATVIEYPTVLLTRSPSH